MVNRNRPTHNANVKRIGKCFKITVTKKLKNLKEMLNIVSEKMQNFRRRHGN